MIEGGAVGLLQKVNRDLVDGELEGQADELGLAVDRNDVLAVRVLHQHPGSFGGGGREQPVRISLRENRVGATLVGVLLRNLLGVGELRGVGDRVTDRLAEVRELAAERSDPSHDGGLQVLQVAVRDVPFLVAQLVDELEDLFLAAVLDGRHADLRGDVRQDLLLRVLLHLIAGRLGRFDIARGEGEDGHHDGEDAEKLLFHVNCSSWKGVALLGEIARAVHARAEFLYEHPKVRREFLHGVVSYLVEGHRCDGVLLAGCGALVLDVLSVELLHHALVVGLRLLEGFSANGLVLRCEHLVHEPVVALRKPGEAEDGDECEQEESYDCRGFHVVSFLSRAG